MNMTEENKKTYAEKMLEILSDYMVLLMKDEVDFHLSDCINFHYWSECNL